jgi:peptide subunit release factor RF-3
MISISVCIETIVVIDTSKGLDRGKLKLMKVTVKSKP